MRFPIGARLLAGFLAVIFLAGLIALVAVTRLSELSSVTEHLAQKEIPEVHLLWRMHTLIEEMGMDFNHFLSGAGAEHRLRLQKGSEALEASLAAYQVLHPLLSDEEGRLLAELTRRHELLQEATSQIISFTQSGQEDRARTLFHGKWRDLRQAVVQSSGRLFVYEDRELAETATVAAAHSRSGRTMVIALALAGALLSLALSFAITHSITKPVKRLIGATERAMRGDLGTQTDVAKGDEIGLLAQRFDALMAQLNKSFEEQRRFFADASHELRTPLTVIRGEAEVTLRGTEKPVAEYKEALGVVATLAGQMGRFVDELLFLARSEAGEIRYESIRMQLASILEEIYQQSKGLAQLKGAHLKLDVREPVEIYGDPGQLRQLFLTLVDNGIKYSSPEGQVTIALDVSSGRARVLVSDTGIGIPEQDLPYIFERFYRAVAARPRSDGGTGLGLSIAKSIIDAHNGEITVQSTLGTGTTFTILLPRTSALVAEVRDAPLVSGR